MRRFRFLPAWFLAAVMLTGCSTAPKPMERYGMVIKVRNDKLEHYRALHANPWQGVLDQIDKSHLHNFSIWLGELHPKEYYLFAYFEYDGDDLAADMARMGEDAETQRWWKETDPCQQPIDTARKGEHWVMLEEVFFHDKDMPGIPLMPAPVRKGDDQESTQEP